MNYLGVRTATLGVTAAMALVTLGGCGPEANSPPAPSVEWNQQKYGKPPEKRPLSAVEITTEKTWVVAREKNAPAAAASPGAPKTTCTARVGIGGMDCGDCQHLVADELGRLSGVRLARVSQSPPETVVEYDPTKLDAKQIEGTVAGLGLWPKPLPSPSGDGW